MCPPGCPDLLCIFFHPSGTASADQSSPSTSAAAAAGDSRLKPSMIGGPLTRPLSSACSPAPIPVHPTPAAIQRGRPAWRGGPEPYRQKGPGSAPSASAASPSISFDGSRPAVSRSAPARDGGVPAKAGIMPYFTRRSTALRKPISTPGCHAGRSYRPTTTAILEACPPRDAGPRVLPPLEAPTPGTSRKTSRRRRTTEPSSAQPQ